MEQEELDNLKLKLKNNNKIFGWNIITIGVFIAIFVIFGSILPNFAILYIILPIIGMATIVSVIVYFAKIQPLEKKIYFIKNGKMMQKQSKVLRNYLATDEEMIKKKIEKFSFLITFFTFFGLLLGEILFKFGDVIIDKIVFYVFFPAIGLTIFAIIYLTVILISLQKKLKAIMKSDNLENQIISSDKSNENSDEQK